MPEKANPGPYDGRYDNIMEGEFLIWMRESMEKLDAGKITKKEYDKVVDAFTKEFPKSAIKLLKKDIERDKKK